MNLSMADTAEAVGWWKGANGVGSVGDPDCMIARMMEKNLLMSRQCSWRPRLFIYDLPSGYQDSGQHSIGSLGTVLPNASSLPGFPRAWSLRSTDQFALGVIFFQRALLYPCRTVDAAAADLFLVPAFSSRLSHRPTAHCMEDDANASRLGGHPASLYSRLRSVHTRHGGPALAARGGADHIFINPRNGASYEARPTCELDYTDSRLGLRQEGSTRRRCVRMYRKLNAPNAGHRCVRIYRSRNAPKTPPLRAYNYGAMRPKRHRCVRIR